MSFEFKLVQENWKKDIWNKKFRNNYYGKLRAYGSSLRRSMLSRNNKYITMNKNGTDCGFARISNQSRFVQTFFTDEIWCIEEIYIEPKFRHQGCAEALICHLRENYNAYMIYMQKNRAERLVEFHENIGFSEILPHHSFVDMVHVCYNPYFSMNETLVSNDNEIEKHQQAA